MKTENKVIWLKDILLQSARVQHTGYAADADLGGFFVNR